MKVLVGSNNPIKIDAVKEAFSLHFEDIDVIARPVESNVSNQPLNNETFIGARNRARKLFDINISEKLGAEFCVGIEGGIMKIFEKWFAFGCMCIVDEQNNEGFGTSAHFELPEEVTGNDPYAILSSWFQYTDEGMIDIQRNGQVSNQFPEDILNTGSGNTRGCKPQGLPQNCCF